MFDIVPVHLFSRTKDVPYGVMYGPYAVTRADYPTFIPLINGQLTVSFSLCYLEWTAVGHYAFLFGG